MSDSCRYYSRWEPLARFHFSNDNEQEEKEKYHKIFIKCVCSRTFIREPYFVYKERFSESDNDVQPNTQSQECDEHSHVHFSLDTSYNVKCEKDEGASCYCSASHTDNYCSTDEHDAAQSHTAPSHPLQQSDSGADLTYQDCHSDYIDKMDHNYELTPDTDENYLAEDTWDKFWAINSERLIWASWIKRYSEYINPAYLNENQDLLMDEKNIPKPHSAEAISTYQNDCSPKVDEGRERKFSYDSKVNPYKKINPDVKRNDKSIEISDSKEDTWVPVARRRSCSEHDRILSPKTLAGTDSMTNVTKITISSYDITSSHVTSESSPVGDYSVSSSTSEDPSHDQTRIANVEENMDLIPSEEVDNDEYWQILWKKHFGEQYSLHYASYIECHATKNKQLIDKPIESAIEKRLDEKLLDIECENSEGNSQEIPSVIEVQTKVGEINLTTQKEDVNEDDKNTEVDTIETLEDEVTKPDIPLVEEKSKRIRKRGKSRGKSALVASSVGLLLQTLLKEQKENSTSTEVMDSGDNNGNDAGNSDQVDSVAVDSSDEVTQNSQLHQSVDQRNLSSCSYDDGDDEPPEEKSIVSKRSHELDEEDFESNENDLVNSTFEVMGFRFDEEKMPKGHLLFKNYFSRLRLPQNKKYAKKTYFDDDGNALNDYQCDESEKDKDMKVEDDDVGDSPINNDTSPETETQNKNDTADNIDVPDVECAGISNETLLENFARECSKVSLPLDIDSSSEAQESKEEIDQESKEEIDQESKEEIDQESKEEIDDGLVKNNETKRRRRQKRHLRYDREWLLNSDLPEEIRNNPKMIKYWKKRHSLFHRFDEGVKLDAESWFSVTPESVARHIANKGVNHTVIDGFCGAGGNALQFAATWRKVIAIDIDPAKIELARHNARVYGVENRIKFIVGDFFELAPTLEADMVFLSPPWGGPKYSKNKLYDIETMLEPKPASELMKTAQLVSTKVIMYLPRNCAIDQILAIAQEMRLSVEIEQNFLNNRFVAITAYFD